MANGLTTDPALSIPSALSPSVGLAGPNGGLSFQGFGGGGPPPSVTNGILLEGSLTDLILMEDGGFILQES